MGTPVDKSSCLNAPHFGRGMVESLTSDPKIGAEQRAARGMDLYEFSYQYLIYCFVSVASFFISLMSLEIIETVERSRST